MRRIKRLWLRLPETLRSIVLLSPGSIAVGLSADERYAVATVLGFVWSVGFSTLYGLKRGYSLGRSDGFVDGYDLGFEHALDGGGVVASAQAIIDEVRQ